MQTRNTFRKAERLNKKKLIDRLFQEGKSLYVNPIKCYSIEIQEKSSSRIQILIAVPKRNIKRAVDRNLIKRRIREAYRLNKHSLIRKLDENDTNLLLAFVYTDRSLKDYKTIENAVKLYIQKYS